jgi:hypothetical protein
MLKKAATAALAVGLGLAALATPVSAATIVTFAQLGVAPPTNFDFTDNGNGTTTISSALNVAISALQGPLVPPPITDAIFSLSATSTTTATTFAFGGVTFLVQRYTGTFSIDAPECGTVCLAGTFVDLLSGQLGGRALNISATEPPVGAVTFTSDEIPAIDIATDRALALAATNFDTAIAEDCTSPSGCTMASNSSNLAGTFSADVGTVPTIPEPSTWAMMLLGFAGLGFVGFRSSKTKLALID